MNIVCSTRTVLMFHTKVRHQFIAMKAKSKRQQKQLLAEDLVNGSRLGLDSHVDMSCAGRHARIMETIQGSLYNVQPFHDSYSVMEDIQTVNVVFAYDTTDGRSYVLHMNQCLTLLQRWSTHCCAPTKHVIMVLWLMISRSFWIIGIHLLI